MITQQKAALERLRSGELSPYLDAPVSVIREVQEDGSEVFIGNLDFSRFAWMSLVINQGVETEETERIQKENDERQAGDPDLAWNLGCMYFSSILFSFVLAQDSTDADRLAGTYA